MNASGPAPHCLWHEVRAQSRGVELVSLTIVPQRAIDTESGIADVYGALAGQLSANGIQLLQEKVFASRDVAPLLDRVRRDSLVAAGADPDMPYTYTGYRPCLGGHLAGLQLLGVRGPLRCQTVRADGCAGRLAEGQGQRALFVAQARGHGSAPEALHAMYDRAAAVMTRYGFQFRNVARTWIYVDDLLRWYNQLNQTRNRWFAREGVGTPGASHHYPASTGIHAADPAGAPCFMDLVATTPDDCTGSLHEELVSPRQGPAAAYGSSFSRAVRVPLWGTQVVYLSGTASIDAGGATCNVGDAGAQIDWTCETADAVLQTADAALARAATGVIYFKDVSAFAEWRKRHRVPATAALPPMIPVYADICRADLLFEIEACSFVRQFGGSGASAHHEHESDGRSAADVLST